MISNANVILFSSDSKGCVAWNKEDGNITISPFSIFTVFVLKAFPSVGKFEPCKLKIISPSFSFCFFGLSRYKEPLNQPSL